MSDTPHSFTDPSGRFTIPVTVRPRRLVARAMGFVPSARAVGTGEGDILFALGRGLGVSGQVVDRSGAGLPGVRVAALGPRAAGPYRRVEEFACPAHTLPNQAVGRSGPTGRFVLTGLRPGRVRLRVSKVGWRPQGPPELGPPGAPEKSGALAPPGTRVVEAGVGNVRIAMEPIWAFSFRAADAGTHRPIPLDHLQVLRRSTPPRPGRRWTPVGVDDLDWFSGKDPRFGAIRGYFFRQDVPAQEELACRISAPGYEWRKVPILPRHPEDPDYLEPDVVQLTPLARPGRIGLTVTMAGAPYRGPLLLQVVGMERGRRSRAEIASGEVDGRGRRVIRLPAGPYRMRVSGIPGSSTLEQESFAVTIPQLGELARTVALDAGLCEIRLVDAQGCGLAGARVRITCQGPILKSWLLWASDARALAERQTSRPPGRFRALLQPGSYVVMVTCFGFQDRLLENVIIGDGRTTSMVVRLEPER